MVDVNTKLTQFAKQLAKDWKENKEVDDGQDVKIGNLSTLKTQSRSSTVDAINELQVKYEELENAPDFVAQFILATK